MSSKIDKLKPGEKYALLIAVEQYNDKLISVVSYAENDAKELASAIKQVGFAETNVKVMLSTQATKTLIESALRNLCKRLRPEDELLLFFAGHGFAENAHNFITCHDTVRGDLPSTSISLQDVLQQIKSSGIRKAVLLLDCCHSGFEIDESMRGLMTTVMMDDDFVAFCGESEFHMAFASCSVDESSFHSKNLEHGIWSHHVISAYQGNAKNALERGHFLTASSLRDYLSDEVPRTLRETHTGIETQNPRMWGDMSREFILADLGDVLARRKAASTPLICKLERSSFWGFDHGSVRSLKGFHKGYRVPDNICDVTRNFVHKVGADNLKEEAESLHGEIRQQFKYRRRDLVMEKDSDGAVTITTPQFTVNITLDIDEDDPSQYEISTEVTDVREPDVLDSDAFSSVFDDTFDQIVFEISGKIPVEEIIDAIEEIDDTDLISVDYSPDYSECTVKARGMNGDLIFNTGMITILMDRKSTTSVLLNESRKLPKLLGQHKLSNLLPGTSVG